MRKKFYLTGCVAMTNKNTVTMSDAKQLLSIFLLTYAIHCVEQVYFIYGNVLESYGFSPQTTGNALGSFFIAIMASRPVGGWMIENLGIKRSLVCGGVMALAGCSVLFFTRSVAGIYAGRILSGLAFGVFTLGIYSYQALVTKPEKRGKFFALTTPGGVLPTATVTPVGEWLFMGGHINSYLALGPLAGAVCLFLGMRTASDSAAHGTGEKKWGTYRDLATRKPFVMLVATGTLMGLIDAALTSVSMFAAERGIVASYFLASYSIVAVISRIFGAKLINSLPRQFCVAPCGMLMAGSLAIAAIAPSSTSFLICGTLFGIGIGGGFPIMMAAISDILPPGLRPKGTAFTLFMYDMAWGTVPIIVGYMTPHIGRAASFIVISAVTFIGLAILSAAYWIPRRISENRAAARESATRR